MTISWAFKLDNGRVIHIAHLSKSGLKPDWIVSLCGASFSKNNTRHIKDALATCRECLRYDDPFNASMVRPLEALLVRDLVTFDKKETPRGAVLARDMDNPTPWVDQFGIVHARDRGSRRVAACGAELLGIEIMTYERLRKMQDLYENVEVDCMSCLAADAV